MISSLWSIVVAGLVFFAVFGAVAYLRRNRTAGNADHPRWNWLEAVAVTVFIFSASFFASQLLLWLGISGYMELFASPGENIDQLLESSIVVQFFASLLFYGLIVLFVYLFLRLRRNLFSSIGLVRPRGRDMGYAALGFVAYFVLYVIIAQFAKLLFPGLDVEQRQELGFSSDADGLMLVLVFLSLVALPAFTEELLTRGVLYSGLRTKLSVIASALITSVIFGLAHIKGGAEGTFLWIAAVDTFTLSLVLVYLREKTGSLWPAIGLHAIKNSIAFVALFIFHVA